MNLGQELWTASYDPARSELAGPNKMVFTLPVPAGASGAAALGQNALQNRTQIGNILGVRVHPLTKADLPGNKPLQAIIGQLPGDPTMVWGEFDGRPINGEYYQPGELSRVHTRWDRPIKVDQKKEPYLMLKMGAKEPPVRTNYDRAASQESGANTAIFSHRIRPGDTSPNGVVIGENGSGLRDASSITDHSGNPASGEWFPDIIVGWKVSRGREFNIVQAAVTSVPINGNAYQAGETIEITLEASGPVFVDDKSAPPYVLLTAGNRRARAHYHAGLSRAAEANKLIFTWRVPEDHEAIEKTVASTPLNGAGSVQNAARITGPDGRRIDPSMPAIWRDISGVEIADYGRPHIVSMGFTSSPKRGMNYRPGEVVEVTLSASSPLQMSAEEQPRLTLRVANIYHTARYDEKRSRAAGAHKLVFVWKVPHRLPVAGRLAIPTRYLRDAGGTRSWSGRALRPSLPVPVQSGFTPGVQTANW